jgi:hypothetical protein
MFCQKCGEKIKHDSKFCAGCGGGVSPGSAPAVVFVPAGRSRIGAALFAIFLGGLGIHKFYLGRPIWGVAYLLLCWTFVPAIVALIEGIIYLTMSDQAFAAKYN